MGVSTFTSNGVNFNFAVLKKKDEFYYEIAVRQQARIDLYFGVGEFNSITMLLSPRPLGHFCRIFMMMFLLFRAVGTLGARDVISPLHRF